MTELTETGDLVRQFLIDTAQRIELGNERQEEDTGDGDAVISAWSMFAVVAQRDTPRLIPTGAYRWAFGDHVPERPAGGGWGSRVCDFLAVDCYNGIGPVELTHPVHGFEIKSSRSDWLTKLRDPTKAEAFKRYCDYWWLVVSDRRIVRDGELPDGWGLLAVAGDRLRSVHQAPRLTAEPWPRPLVASFARAVAKSARAGAS